jgi:hypothetical protein
MDEARLRAELNRIAGSDGPLPRISLIAAMTAGRRQRRLRNARMGGSVLAASAVAGVMAAMLAVHGPAAVQPSASAPPSAAHARTAPARFNPLVPYAAFSRLPAGWHVGQKSSFPGNDLMASSTATQLSLQVWAPDGAGGLTVYAAGQCRSTARTLKCSLVNTPWRKVSRAPDVDGRPAYWLGMAGTSPGSAMMGWQYADGGWAILDWGYSTADAARMGGASRAAVGSLAAAARFGQATPVLFPYTIRGLAGWQITEVDYTMVNGQPSARMLHLAGGHPAGLIQVNAVADSTPLDGPCDRKGQTPDGHASLDGATVDLYAPPGHMVCGDDVDGLQVQLFFEYQSNGKSRPGAALDYARDLQLLGAGQATWQPYPLR